MSQQKKQEDAKSKVRTFTLRVDEDLHQEATALYESMGFDLTTAIRMFMRQSVVEGALPFRPSTFPQSGRTTYQAIDLK